MRIGIDWGGTKIEIIALDDGGETLMRERAPTVKDDYAGCVRLVRDLVSSAEVQLGKTGTVGLGIPGTISPATGLVKNSNSVWMNGQPLKEDLTQALAREVRIQNDANCFAVSEATDGAGQGHAIVSGVIIGTGCGSGIAVEGKAVFGRNGIAGEFGHTCLAPMREDELPGLTCWCGRQGCLELYLSGTGFQLEYDRQMGKETGKSAQEILCEDTPQAHATYAIYCDRLARGLTTLINIVDPDIIVLGGGMSNVASIYRDVPPLLKAHVFSDAFETQIVQAKHGDSSGVRGAAWLWN